MTWSWNGVKRWANQSHVNCLYDMIGQSDMLSSYGTGNITRSEHRGLSGTKRRRSVRDVVPNVWKLVFCQTSWQDLRALSTLHCSTFSWKQVHDGKKGQFDDQIWGCGDCYNLHGLGSQWVTWGEKYQVLCVTLGCSQLQGSCQFAHPLSESVFICLCMFLSWCQVVGQEGIGWTWYNQWAHG